MRISGIYLSASFITLLIYSHVYSFPYKGLDINIGGSVSEMYDDNFEFSSVSEKKDLITRLTSNLDVKYEGKSRTMNFNGYISESIFAKHHNENNTSGRLKLDLQNEFSKYDRIRLDNTFTRIFEPSSSKDEFGRIGGRAKISQNKFDFVYTRDIIEQIDVIARYSNILTKVSGEDGGRSYRNNLGLVTNYISSAATVFFYHMNLQKINLEAREISMPIQFLLV